MGTSSLKKLTSKIDKMNTFNAHKSTISRDSVNFPQNLINYVDIILSSNTYTSKFNRFEK